MKRINNNFLKIGMLFFSLMLKADSAYSMEPASDEAEIKPIYVTAPSPVSTTTKRKKIKPTSDKTASYKTRIAQYKIVRDANGNIINKTPIAGPNTPEADQPMSSMPVSAPQANPDAAMAPRIGTSRSINPNSSAF